MYRLLLESLLGLRKEVDELHVAPRLLAHWRALTIHYRYHATVYRLEISQQPRAEGAPCPAGRLMVDGVEQAKCGFGSSTISATSTACSCSSERPLCASVPSGLRQEYSVRQIIEQRRVGGRTPADTGGQPAPRRPV
jgi:hypothetical protein